MRQITSGGGSDSSSVNCAAPLSGLPLGMRNSNRRRSANSDSERLVVVQLIPAETAVDEKHAPIRVSGGARRGANRIRGFADQQRFVTRHQVAGRQAARQRGRQLFGAQAQAKSREQDPRARPAYSRCMRETSASTVSIS